MKVIVIGATGTIGVEVAKALSGNKHEVVRASRNSDVKINLDDPASIRAMFEKVRDADAVVSCAGSAAFKPFADLTDADYELGIRGKLMGEVAVARLGKDCLRDGGGGDVTDPASLADQLYYSLLFRGKQLDHRFTTVAALC